MESILYFEINILAITLLILMLFNFGGQTVKTNSFDQKLFCWLIIMVGAIIFFDSVAYFVNGQDSLPSEIINKISNFFYYGLQAVTCFVWLLYGDYKVYTDVSRLKRKLPLYGIPMVIILLMIIANWFIPFFYYFDDNNLYCRGSLFIPYLIAFLSYLLSSMAVVFFGARKYQGSRRSLLKYLLIFPALPVIGTIIQLRFYGIPLIWICATFSLLIIYVNLQNELVVADFLTGLNNRRRFESYLNKTIKLVSEDKPLFLTVLDIDDFKQINDSFGHSFGDEALKDIAGILKQCIEKNDFLARLGGDELVIVGQRGSEEEISEFVAGIHISVENFNKKECRRYKLELSSGTAIYTKEHSPESLVREADRRMYKMKFEKHKYI